MGVSNILIARTDSESGKLLSSNIDSRDHEFILGVADVTAKSIKSQSELLYELEINGASAAEMNAAELEWTQKHPLVTFTEGISIHLTNISRQTKSRSLCSIQCLFLVHPRKVPHT